MSERLSPAIAWRRSLAPYGSFDKLRHFKKIRDQYMSNEKPETKIKTEVTVFDSQSEVLPQAAK